ncbi:MAG: hypothetical protein RIT43_1936 [Bacteroidota bacterium]|jgi:hypothetical protein
MLYTLKYSVTLFLVHSDKLMKKGGGIGPVKPWQPSRREGAKSYSEVVSEKDK